MLLSEAHRGKLAATECVPAIKKPVLNHRRHTFPNFINRVVAIDRAVSLKPLLDLSPQQEQLFISDLLRNFAVSFEYRRALITERVTAEVWTERKSYSSHFLQAFIREGRLYALSRKYLCGSRL